MQFGCAELLVVIITFLKVGCKFDILSCFFIASTCNISLSLLDNCFMYSCLIYMSLVRQFFLQPSFSHMCSALYFIIQEE